MVEREDESPRARPRSRAEVGQRWVFGSRDKSLAVVVSNVIKYNYKTNCRTLGLIRETNLMSLILACLANIYYSINVENHGLIRLIRIASRISPNLYKKFCN